MVVMVKGKQMLIRPDGEKRRASIVVLTPSPAHDLVHLWTLHVEPFKVFVISAKQKKKKKSCCEGFC